MKRLLKWLAILIIVLLLLVVLILAASYFLLATERGFKMATGELQERVEGLELGEVSGDLESGINTNSVRYKNDQLSIDATGIESQWRSGCLVDMAVCIDKVVVDELNIETFDTGEKAEPSTADIELPEIKLPLSFNARDVLVKKLRFKAPGDAPAQELENIKLSAYTEGNQLRIDELSTKYNNITLNSSGYVTPTGDYPLDMELNIDLEDFLEDFDAIAKIKLNNSLADLNLDATISGAVNATIIGNVHPLRKSLPLDITVKSAEAGWPLDTLAMAKATDTELHVKGSMQDFAIDLGTQLSGEQIPQTSLSLEGLANTERALVTDITALTMDGFATGNAAVSWQDGLTWVGELIAKDINPETKFEGVPGKLNGLILASGDLRDGKWTLDLNKARIDGVLRDLPFDLNAKLEKRADETWQLDALTLDNGNNRVVATGSVNTEWDMDAEILLPDLQNLLPDLSGGFSATLKLIGELKNPDAVLKANSKSIKYNEIAIAGLSIDADVKRGALQPSKLALNVSNVTAGTQAIKNTRLNLGGTREKHQISFFADGPQKTSIDLKTTGGLSDSFDWSGLLQSVKLEVPAHVINLRDPTKLAWNNEKKKFSVDAHCWSIQDSNLCLENQILAENTGQARVSLDSYGLEQLNPFLPAQSQLKGMLNSKVVVDWGEKFAGGYAITLAAGVAGGGINVRDTSGQPLLFQYETLALKSKADAKAVVSTLTFNSKDMGQAQVNLDLDPASEKKNISGDVTLSGFKIDFLKAFLPDYEKIAGSVSAKGDLSGGLTDPLFDGEVVLSSLQVRADSLPIAIDDGSVTSKIAGKRADIEGQLQSGNGSLGVDGKANWVNNTWRADISLNAKELNIVSDPLTESTVNAKIKLSARPEQIRVRGSIDVPSAEINIKELPRGAATVSDDVIIVEDIYAQTQKKKEKQKAATDIDVKINVTLGDKVNLAGYGLEANLTGNMQVSQRSPTPVQLGGEVTIVNGVYKQYGQDLKITDGQILFVGPVDQTTLDIDAVREVENGARVAGLHIDGRVENPEISLFTEPADKTQESILSYIVLGRDLGDASDQESNLLASAALALTLRGGRAYTDSLADSLGMQEISLDARGSGDDTEVVVSGRVNDRLLLRYGRSVFDDSFTLYLRYDLTKQLYLEAAQGAARAVDIFYSFSF